MDNRIPVTIITGFLGSGKTTLLNRIIEENRSKRFAIIENEVGDINIDSDLILNNEEDIFEITNGCLCCSLNVEFAKLLLALVKRKGDYDHLIIETTGIADPSAVAAAFIAEIKVQEHFQLDGVVCLVDALNFKTVLKTQETEVAKQISFADVLIFNKMKAVPSTQLQDLAKIIHQLNPYTEIMAANYAAVPTSNLLNLKAFQPKKIEAITTTIKHHHAYQHGQITAQSYTLERPFDYLKFRHFVQVLLNFQGMRIHRMKGILNIHGQNHKIIFQSVQKQVVFTQGQLWKNDEKRISQLVVIGNGLKKAAFNRKLKQCVL